MAVSKIPITKAVLDKYASGGFVVPFHHSQSLMDLIMSVEGGEFVVGVDMAGGRDETSVTFMRRSANDRMVMGPQFTLNRPPEFVKPRTGDLQQMIADIDSVELTPASSFHARERNMIDEMKRAMDVYQRWGFIPGR